MIPLKRVDFVSIDRNIRGRNDLSFKDENFLCFIFFNFLLLFFVLLCYM